MNLKRISFQWWRQIPEMYFTKIRHWGPECKSTASCFRLSIYRSFSLDVIGQVTCTCIVWNQKRSRESDKLNSVCWKWVQKWQSKDCQNFTEKIHVPQWGLRTLSCLYCNKNVVIEIYSSAVVVFKSNIHVHHMFLDLMLEVLHGISSHITVASCLNMFPGFPTSRPTRYTNSLHHSKSLCKSVVDLISSWWNIKHDSKFYIII